MAERWATSVPCRDLAGRIRTTKVLVTEAAEIAVVTPAGGSGVWHPSEVRQLVEAVIAAQMEAADRRGGER